MSKDNESKSIRVILIMDQNKSAKLSHKRENIRHI